MDNNTDYRLALPAPGEVPASTQNTDGWGNRIIAAAVADKDADTARAYRQDLRTFARFCGGNVELDSGLAVELLLRAGDHPTLRHGRANALVLTFKQHLLSSGAAPSTINRRLAALRSIVRTARILGLIDWSLDISGARHQTYRDTRGPGLEGYQRLYAAIEGDDPKPARDRAILRLMFDRGLRRGEVAGLDMSDLDLPGRRVQILGKGRREKEWVTLPESTCEALRAWIAHRGQAAGPLFIALDRAAHGHRLTDHSIWRVVVKLGRKVGINVDPAGSDGPVRNRARPHGLRHASGTAALDRTGGDIRAVQQFMRHADASTTLIYDDNRRDLAGTVADLVAAAADGSSVR